MTITRAQMDAASELMAIHAEAVGQHDHKYRGGDAEFVGLLGSLVGFECDDGLSHLQRGYAFIHAMNTRKLCVVEDALLL